MAPRLGTRASVQSRANVAGPQLTIDFTSQGGGLYVRNYPASVDPELVPQWPGYPVSLEPRPYLGNEPAKIRRQMLRDWHRRLRTERASKQQVSRLMPGPCVDMRFERSQTRGALASAAMLAALAIALMPGRPMALVIALAAVGLAALVAAAAPDAVALVSRRRSTVLVFLLAALILAWVVAGVLRANQLWPTPEGAYEGRQSRADVAGPQLTIDFTSQGGGLYVRDYRRASTPSWFRNGPAIRCRSSRGRIWVTSRRRSAGRCCATGTGASGRSARASSR